MDEQEQRGREYLKDIVGESVPRATWPDGLRAQLEEFLAAAPGLLPPTHPKGPRSLDHMPWAWKGLYPDALFEDPAPDGVCVLRRSCGRSCYCAKAGAEWARSGGSARTPVDAVIRYAPEVVEQLRARFGRHWPAEPPMLERSAVRSAMFGPAWDQPGARPLSDLQAYINMGSSEPEPLAAAVSRQALIDAYARRMWDGR